MLSLACVLAATITGGAAGMIGVESLTNSVRVRVCDTAGAPADLPFVLDVF